MGRKGSNTNVAARVHSEDSEIDFETLVREEFKKLHREYRLMEDARHLIAGKGKGKMSQQGSLLERLKLEKEDLADDLKIAGSKENQVHDKESIRTILEGLERYENFKMDIASCTLSINEMEANVDRITQKLIEQKLKVQAMYGQSMTVPEADHRQAILENRLYHVTTQFDTLVSQNKALKLEINMMLKLRGNFYSRMMTIKQLSSKIKQKMGDVVYEATGAYDQRDDWKNKANLLREKNDKDSKQHCLEIKEFQRILHHDSKTHEFLASKNQERDELENAAQRSNRRNETKIAELDNLLVAYKKSFKAILGLAKSKDIESLVDTYLEQEQTNYAVFKYITDLNHESNILQKDIAETKVEIERLSRKAIATAKEQQEATNEMNQNIADALTLVDATLDKWKETDTFMEQVCKLVDEAFNAAECSNAGILALLGNKDGMKPHNLTLCMKSLEHRTTELLFEKAVLEIRKLVEIEGNQLPKKPTLWVQGIKPPPVGGPFKNQVHITGRMDADHDDEDEDMKAWSEQPIYYRAMNQKLREKLHRKSMATQPSSAVSLTVSTVSQTRSKSTAVLNVSQSQKDKTDSTENSPDSEGSGGPLDPESSKTNVPESETKAPGGEAETDSEEEEEVEEEPEKGLEAIPEEPEDANEESEDA